MSEFQIEQEDIETPEEIIRQWIAVLDFTIKNLREEKPNNELEFTSGIQLLLAVMKKDIKEWIKWAFPSTHGFGLNNVLAEADKETLTKTFEGMRELVIKWLEFDKEISSIVATKHKNPEIIDISSIFGQTKKENRHYI